MGAKVLRFAALTQDDKRGGYYESVQILIFSSYLDHLHNWSFGNCFHCCICSNRCCIYLVTDHRICTDTFVCCVCSGLSSLSQLPEIHTEQTNNTTMSSMRQVIVTWSEFHQSLSQKSKIFDSSLCTREPLSAPAPVKELEAKTYEEFNVHRRAYCLR